MEIEKQRNKLSGAERWLSLLGGSAVVYYGLKRRSWFRSALALVGGRYLLRGLTGQRRPLEFLGLTAPANSLPYGRGIKVRRSVTIDKSPEELYRFWRNFENLPRFLGQVESVRLMDDKRSHWVIRGPAGRTVEWFAEIVADRPNEMIGWRSLSAGVDHAGSVRFVPAHNGRGTVVRVQLQYSPPGGRITRSLALLFGETPDQQLHEALHRFKQLMETGEIATTEGQPSGRGKEIREKVLTAGSRAETARIPEPVEEASEESFPASDAPSWTSGGQG